MLLGGRYKLLSAPLSTGSFGSVFVAEDERMPRRVAVKILHPQHAENPTVRARFRRELEAACRVSHENVVGVHDIGEDPQLGLYYVMELVRGTPLKDYLNGEPLPWAFVFRVATQIARALHAINSAGIVHRDLKPQNIMLVERSSLEELVKVLDFGIASLKTPEEEKRDVELTGARMVLGTPPYMSPEQTYMRSDRERLGLDVDARSDIYSLGIICYEMAAGRRPFSGDAHEIVVAHRLTRPMPLERMVGVAVPREFAELTMRCLAKDPKERPQSAKEFLSALRECELKPVRRWSELQAADPKDPRDSPTLGEAPALPMNGLSVDTQPRIELPQRPKSKALWWPLVGLGLGAIGALVAILTTEPDAHSSAIEISAASAKTAGTSERAAPVKPPAAVDAAPARPDEVKAKAAAAAQAAVEAQAAEAKAAGVKAAAEAKAAADARAAAQVARVGVLVTSQPPGAEVIIDGKVEGKTPVNLSFEVAAKREIELVLRLDRFEDQPVVLPIGPELGGQTLVVNESLARKKAGKPSNRDNDPFKDL